MVQGNWDDELILNGSSVIARGPLELDDGEELVEVYAWLLQSGGGRFARWGGETEDAADNGTAWVIADGKTNDGALSEGPAHAMAIAIAKVGATFTHFWWEEDVELRRGASAD